MDEANKTSNMAGAQPLLQVMKGVLQFVGGGLLALREEQPVEKSENPSDRAVRERLEGMGLATDHAEKIRRAWKTETPATPAPPPSPAEPTTIPRFSFDEFAAAMATPEPAPGGASEPHATTSPESRNVVETSTPERAPTTPSPSSLPRSLEELVAMAPPARDAIGPVPSPKKEEKSDVERRFERLEARLVALQQQLADVLGEDRHVDEARTGISEEPTPRASSTVRANDADPLHGSTVVQGPWAMSPSPRGESEPIASEDPSAGDAYHAHEQRVAALEDTFGQLERMVEGLAAKPRPPS